jgi:hypothetical protein
MSDDEPKKQISIQIKINLNAEKKTTNNYNNYKPRNNNYHQNNNNYYKPRNDNYNNNYNNKPRNNNYNNKPRNNNYNNKPRYNNDNQVVKNDRFGGNNYNKNNNYNNNNRNNNNYNNNRNNNNYNKNNNNNYHNKKSKKNQRHQKHPQYNNMENDQLNTHWTIHIHNTSETDWTLHSYKKVFVIKKITDFWTFFNNFTDLQKFNFYVMRGDIKPVYEDKNNTNGYSYSYIIPGRKVNQTFIHVLAEMMCEKLVNIKNYNEVCGVSLVPKPNGISIFKIWMRNKNNVLDLKIKDDNLINGRYQEHKLY